MRRALAEEGFSARTIEIILSCHKESTVKHYQCAWAKFCDYLRIVGVRRQDRLKSCHVLNFLAFEQETHDRAYSTIAGYKCALDLPLKISQGLVVSDERTKRFMQGCYNLNPPRKRPMPSWDLSHILTFLQTDKFEDIRDIPFILLTLKLLFLLLIATGRRISEIAALSRSTFVKGKRTFIKWLPGFRPKWDSAHSKFVPESPSILKMDAKSRSRRTCPLRA